MPGRDELDELLDEILENPRRRRRLEAQIGESFTDERAVFVLDMTGFSRTTQTLGILEFLLVMRRLRRVADPVVARHRGDVLKSEADNLYCVFPAVADALAAARDITDGLEPDVYVSIGIGYGPVLLIGDDDFMGNEVNLSSKLGEDIADRGETLLTEAAAEQIPDEELEERTVSVSGLELRHFALVGGGGRRAVCPGARSALAGRERRGCEGAALRKRL